jgi:hypothetical protein
MEKKRVLVSSLTWNDDRPKKQKSVRENARKFCVSYGFPLEIIPGEPNGVERKCVQNAFTSIHVLAQNWFQIKDLWKAQRSLSIQLGISIRPNAGQVIQDLPSPVSSSLTFVENRMQTNFSV